MSEEYTSLVPVDLSSAKIKVHKLGSGLSASEKKDVVVGHDETTGGYQPLFPIYYEMNNKSQSDPKTRQIIRKKATFTRCYRPDKNPATDIFSTQEIIFIPLWTQKGRVYYEKQYDSKGEKKAPDCQSQNGIVPLHNRFATDCASCALSQWVGKTPPPCGENPDILGFDMTSSVIEDKELKALATKEIFTIKFGKSVLKAFRQFKEALAEPQLFDDKSYGKLDISRFLVKLTTDIAYDSEGQELTYCVPTFTIIGYVPAETSEQLLKAVNTPLDVFKGKTAIEWFVGNKEPFTNVQPSEGTPAPAPVATPMAPKTPRASAVSVSAAKQTIEVTSTPVEEPKTEILDASEGEIEFEY